MPHSQTCTPYTVYRARNLWANDIGRSPTSKYKKFLLILLVEKMRRSSKCAGLAARVVGLVDSIRCNKECPDDTLNALDGFNCFLLAAAGTYSPSIRHEPVLIVCTLTVMILEGRSELVKAGSRPPFSRKVVISRKIKNHQWIYTKRVCPLDGAYPLVFLLYCPYINYSRAFATYWLSTALIFSFSVSVTVRQRLFKLSFNVPHSEW